MRNTVYVTVNGREYSVTERADATGNWVEIVTSWEQVALGQASYARPRHEVRYRAVSPDGRLGKKVLAALAKMKEMSCA